MENPKMPPKKRRTKQRKSKKQSAAKKSASRRKSIGATRRGKAKKEATPRAGTPGKRSAPRKKATIDTINEIERETRDRRLQGTRGARPQSDFQGLSRAEEADSESVEELVEEGNVSESGVIAGVEEADTEEEREVHTRELPVDDVPDEYLERD
jgi:hypothetical protein